MTTRVLEPGSVLGMLGGGQLGRMFALAARRCGYRVVVFGDPPDSPAGQVADRCFASAFDDESALQEFARVVDAVTYEQENIPVSAVEFLMNHVAVCPGPELLKASQHRFLEKSSLRKLGIPTADFALVKSPEDAFQAIQDFGGQAILKTVTLGYDGKGQARVSTETDLTGLWKSGRFREAIAERIVEFDFELSIVASRFADGHCAFYAPVLNYHANHILDLSVSPSSQISTAQTQEAIRIARAILEHFHVTGVLCVEFFATHDGGLLVNEIAPRPHNSGHLTIDACPSSQFEQQFRAVCGLPSGDVSSRSPAAMINLLGDHLVDANADRWKSVFGQPDTFVHLYGKAESRTGRKMGHITCLGATEAEAVRRARNARQLLGWKSTEEWT